LQEKIEKYPNFIFKGLLLLLILFISSDVFLAIDISDATIRFSNILFLIIFILWIIYSAFRKNFIISRDRSFLPLFLFCFLSFVSTVNSVFPVKSLIYALWTSFSALTILFLVWFAQGNKLSNLDWMLKVYLYSYFVIAVFGIYQICLAFLAGEKILFVTQWLKTGIIARISGFSFEPSYFATYMLIGSFVWFIIWIRNNGIVKYRSIILFIIFLVVLLSTSRVGWIGLALIMVYGFIELVVHYLKNRSFTLHKARFFISVILIILFLIIFILFIFNSPESWSRYLFRGTGLFNTADYSYATRSDRTIDTLKVFIDRPLNLFLGVGPGGVGAYMADNPAKFEVAEVLSSLWAVEPNSIFAEMLASVGIIGFTVFMWFIILIFKRLWDLYKNANVIEKYRSICLALFCGLILEIIILQFNQNYLRPYLWLHIGICIATIKTLETSLKDKKDENQ